MGLALAKITLRPKTIEERKVCGLFLPRTNNRLRKTGWSLDI